MMENDLSRLERDSRDIDMRMQALKPQILKLTEEKNHYHKYVACLVFRTSCVVCVVLDARVSPGDLEGEGSHTQPL